MNNKIDVLDHGYVRLVSYTQPVPNHYGCDYDQSVDVLGYVEGTWTGDLEIVRNARVSYNADWRGEPDGTVGIVDKDEKLIHYLWKHQHTSPFEAMVFTFEVQAPIFVFRQWHRHRTWSYNEVSARYTELPDLFYVPKPEHIGVQSKTNKQGRELTVDEIEDEMKHDRRGDFVKMLQEHCYETYAQYKLQLAFGIPRELARMVLPVNVYSRMFATVGLRNLFHFLSLRLDAHAQYEIRVYAQALLDLIRPIVPVAVAAWEEANAKQHQDR